MVVSPLVWCLKLIIKQVFSSQVIKYADYHITIEGLGTMWVLVMLRVTYYLAIGSISSLINPLNSQMIFWREYDVKVLKTIIIIIVYNMNNFVTSYDNIIVHYYKSWIYNYFNFLSELVFWIKFNYSFFQCESRP
jgi:hypothetical protein